MERSAAKRMGRPIEDLSGRRFGRLTVIRQAERHPDDRVRFLCLCDCGAAASVTSQLLKSGRTTSCGCYRREVNANATRSHGMTRSGEYRSWRQMHTRCLNRNAEAYKNYGGRGIKICDRWRGPGRFENFLADMGKRPGPRYSLDRIDNDGDYTPDNCRWTTMTMQRRNTRINHLITAFGETLPVSVWAERFGMYYGTLLRRINVQKLDPEAALTRPIKKYRKHSYPPLPDLALMSPLV